MRVIVTRSNLISRSVPRLKRTRKVLLVFVITVLTVTYLSMSNQRAASFRSAEHEARALSMMKNIHLGSGHRANEEPSWFDSFLHANGHGTLNFSPDPYLDKPEDKELKPNRRDFKPDFEWVTGRLARKEKALGRTFADAENCTKNLPQALIVGVMKCGTEALATFLALHPDIAMQMRLQTVEFFNKNYKKGYDWYRDQMPCSSKGQITMEKSPQYFASRFVPERIHSTNSSIKLIMIVREPVKRAISQYSHVKSVKPSLYPNSFEKTVVSALGNIDSYHETISRSLYSIHLKRWLEYFKMDQIHIANGDNFQVNHVEELNKIEKFLGLRPYITQDLFTYNSEKGFYCINVSGNTNNTGCMGAGKGRQHPEVSPEIIERLRVFFKPYNEEFFRIIGQKFDWGY